MVASDAVPPNRIGSPRIIAASAPRTPAPAPVWASARSLRHAQRDFHFGLGRRSPASATIVADRSTPQKHVWRARIILLTADSLGTNGIMAATGKSKTTVWRWQERFMEAGVAGARAGQVAPARQGADRRGARGRGGAPRPDRSAGRAAARSRDAGHHAGRAARAADRGARQTFAISTIHDFYRRPGVTYKKTAHASEQAREDVAARRAAWFQLQPDLTRRSWFFSDGEPLSAIGPRTMASGTTTKMPPRHRRQPRRRPPAGVCSHGRGVRLCTPGAIVAIVGRC